jgi:hypothetical protein
MMMTIAVSAAAADSLAGDSFAAGKTKHAIHLYPLHHKI